LICLGRNLISNAICFDKFHKASTAYSHQPC
jgi:hypothetical protein